MVCSPADKALVVSVAEPEARVTVAKAVEPSRKVTVPVGVPEPEAGATVAVKVTELPETDGLALLARVVVVASLFTTFCTKARLVLAEKLELPWYSAVML